MNELELYIMDNDKINEYSKKYKTVQKRLTVGIMIFILIIGLLLIASAITILCYNRAKEIIIVACIMIVLGILDIILALRFNYSTQKKILKLDDKTAYERYARIHGIKIEK